MQSNLHLHPLGKDTKNPYIHCNKTDWNMKKHKTTLLATLIVVVVVAMGFLPKQIAETLNENETMKKLKQKFNSYIENHSEDRVYLHFDKPFYEPGESIWFEAYVQNGADMEASKSEIVYVEFISPKGNKEKELKLIAKNGKASGDIQLGEDASGGIYKIKAYTKWQKNENNPSFFEKDIQVQKVILPRLKMKLKFEREGYSAGESVEAKLNLESLNNESLSDYNFSYVASLKGKEILRKKGETDGDGKAIVKFDLPNNLATSDGLLNVVIQYNGQTESISRAIPIVLNKVDLAFFPEGGDMIAGLEGKVAFRALNEFGKPADVSGTIKNSKGETVANFNSFHQGMGAFEIQPKKGETYTAHLLSPKTDKVYKLPESLNAGYAISVLEINESKLKIKVQSTVNEELSLFGQVRGNSVYANSFKLKAGESETFTVSTADFPMGVTQFTLFDSRGIARAERLAYANPDKQLKIQLKTDKDKYMPREKVELTITVEDERGIGIPGNFSLSVTDDKLVSFADDKQGNILSKLLLEPDLKSEVYEPNFYFDKEEENSALAMDYLMMTQGWRRFTWEELGTKELDIVRHPRERAIISGIVYDQNSKPLSGAEVRVVQDSITVKTDKDGRFYFKGVVLYESKTITASNGEMSNSAFVSDYAENLNLYLRPNYPRKTMARRNKEGARGNIEIMEMAFGGAMDEAIEEEIMVVEDKVVEKNFIPEPVVVEKPRPKKELKAKNDLANFKVMDLMAEVEERFDAKDFRLEKKKIAESKEPTYFRARNFPEVDYASNQKPEFRTDFRQTIYWNGNVEIGKNGKATVGFYASDAITAFRATLEGVGAGMVGRAEQVFYTQLPFSMDVKVPNEVTMGDLVQIPVMLTNNTGEVVNGNLDFNLPAGWNLANKFDGGISIPAKETVTEFISFNIKNFPETGEIKFTFKGDDGSEDAFIQAVKIVQKGFPVAIALSGEAMEKEYKFSIKNPVEGTVSAKLTAYPTALSDMLSGIESILREPHGCFEQTSSSTYPNIMVKQYLQENDVKNPTLYAKADNLIDKGYNKLVTFETSEHGYEWFGGAPGHEALTAYGLMEFADMKKVYGKVDEGMMNRTANWLLEKRDGNGGFKKNPRALDSFGRAEERITNAYIVYSLSEAGYTKEIEKELEMAYKSAQSTQDPYEMGLMANALFNTHDARANKFLTELNQLQQKDGRFEGNTHSITRSTGKGLQIETTSLAVLANLKAEEKSGAIINSATKFIMENRASYGGYGNTQSTVMALKALTEFAKFAKQTADSGDIEVLINGKKVAEQHFEKGQQGEIEVYGLEEHLKAGNHKIEIRFTNTKKALPYTVSVNYNTFLPQTSAACLVGLSTKLADDKASMGETVRLTTELKNLSKTEGQPMTIAIVGIPAGLSAQPWQLKELQEKQAFDYYEVIGNNVVFYYRQLTPNESKTINLDLKAEIPGKYEAAASSAYLYYTAEHKAWVAGEKVEVRK
ncbi:MAG: hypothetical protein ACJAWV_000335 [Flammeovirgaceae bacterium]|jgi:hypothetical protein